MHQNTLKGSIFSFFLARSCRAENSENAKVSVVHLISAHAGLTLVSEQNNCDKKVAAAF